MPDVGANRRMKTQHIMLALTALVLPVMAFTMSAVHAQGIIREPNINIGPRINPNVASHVDANIAGRAATNVGHAVNVGRINPVIRAPQPALNGRLVVQPHLPYLHTSPSLYPSCEDAGECVDVLATTDGNGTGSSRSKGRGGGPRRNAVQAVDVRTIADEIVAEIDGTLSNAQADELARRHGLQRVGSQSFPLIGATIGLFRITDRRSVETVRRELATEASVRSVQPNYRYVLQEQKAALSEGDPAQYALGKLRLPQAHTLAHGTNVRVAVIDSAIDVRHPELANSIVDSFDALGSSEGPHVHGTGVAGAIAAHARLMGGAPAAQILAIRAFGTASRGTQSTSYVILKGLDYAASHGAQIINMSFAGPKDELIERAIAAVAARGIVMVAAAGNAGEKSLPLYPAADPDVIAVSATDAQDHLFSASNRGGYIAVAAPGVDIFLPAPDDKYQMTSGTSFSSAYVSGIAALMLERDPALKPGELRAMLMKTARDIGSPGRDDEFGAGEADAYTAVEAAIAAAAAPVASMSAPSPDTTRENVPERRENPPVRALNAPVSTMPAEKPVTGEATPAAAQ